MHRSIFTTLHFQSHHKNTDFLICTMNSETVLLNFWSSVPHFHLYKYSPSNPQAPVIDNNLEVQPLRERLRVMVRACMINVKLVLCRFQIILMYTKSLVSQTRRQKSSFLVHWLPFVVSLFLLYTHTMLHFCSVKAIPLQLNIPGSQQQHLSALY